MKKKDNHADKRTEAEMEPGFFSDYGYGNGALKIIYDPMKDKKKSSTKSKNAKNKRK